MYSEKGVLFFEEKPALRSEAAVVGKREGDGPLRDGFDEVVADAYAGTESFEQAESELMRRAVGYALTKAGSSREDIGIAFCGDLLNQCVASTFAFRDSGIPYAGVYGACSTMALGMILSAMAVSSGAACRALCAASSHYCTAERQYRFPLEYGSQRAPSAQWTVTGSGALVIGKNRPGDPYIHSACIGRIRDLGVTDQNNMGAAMAPAVVKMGT